MREFAKDEIIKAKCPVCGCRNKVYTDHIDVAHHRVGYSLKCCNCGNYNAFNIDYKSNGNVRKIPFTQGKQICIQPSFCPHKDCKLYGTCTDPTFTKKPPMPHKKHDGTNLDVNVYNTPRFL